MIIRKIYSRRSVQTLVVVCSVLLLNACATTPPVPSEAIQVELSTPVDGIARGNTDDEEVAKLWSSAEQAIEAGEEKVALNLVYKALEIAPQNPLLWSRAAELQLDSLNGPLAESYATKSNAFAEESESTLMYRNWLIIEQSRKLRGDLLGARSARKKVQEFQIK